MTSRAATELCLLGFVSLFSCGSGAALARCQPRAKLAGNIQVDSTRQVEEKPRAPAAANGPVFDVAAIRENQSDHTARSHIISSPNDGRFTAINVPLKMLIQFAYGIPESRILDGPSWISVTKFDIDAKADSEVDDQLRALDSEQGKAQKRIMLQTLLADRFQLRAHSEARELPMYSLVAAKNGPRFLESKANGTTIDGRNGRIQVQGGENTVALLAEQLANSLGRPVVDETGIRGRYNITLQWAADSGAVPKFGGAGDYAAALDSAGPSLFTAIEEQLGLKLVPRKGPVEVLIVDHIEGPSAN